MYIIHIHKIEIETKHIHTQNSLHHPCVGNTAAHPYTTHICTQKAKWAYYIHYLIPQMEQIRLMYATVRGVTVYIEKNNIKHKMECH